MPQTSKQVRKETSTSKRKVQQNNDAQKIWIDSQMSHNDKRIRELEDRLSHLTDKLSKPSASSSGTSKRR